MLFFLTLSIAASITMSLVSTWLRLSLAWYPFHLLIGFCLLCYCSWHNRGLWGILFGIDAAAQLIGLSLTFVSPMAAYSVSTFLNLAMNLIMIGTAAAECFSQRRRDWLHWLGISTAGFAIASSLFWWFAPMFGLFS